MYVTVYEIVIGAVLTVSKHYVHSVAIFFRCFFRINAKERTKLQAVQNVVGVGHELPNSREVSFAVNVGDNLSCVFFVFVNRAVIVRINRVRKFIIFAFRTIRDRYKHFVARNVFFGGNTKERAELNVFKYVVGGVH